MKAIIRTAEIHDITEISTIYGAAVRSSIATFDTTDPPRSSWQEKISSTASGDHTLVAEQAGTVVGFAYSSAFRPRPAYARTRETSIYLTPDATGQGVGRQLYSHLLSLLREDRMHCALAVIAEPNPASAALHESLGFERVGTLREVGWKFGHWVDTTWYQFFLEP